MLFFRFILLKTKPEYRPKQTVTFYNFDNRGPKTGVRENLLATK